MFSPVYLAPNVCPLIGNSDQNMDLFLDKQENIWENEIHAHFG